MLSVSMCCFEKRQSTRIVEEDSGLRDGCDKNVDLGILVLISFILKVERSKMVLMVPILRVFKQRKTLGF